MPKTQNTVLMVLIALSLLAAAAILAARVRVEGADRTVAIAVDYERCQQLAAMCGTSTAAFLRQLKSVGATHVVLSEDTLNDLIQSGLVRMEADDRGVTVVPVAAARARVVAQLAARAPSGKLQEGAGASQSVHFDSPTVLARLETLGMGYSETSVRDAAQSGLAVVARPLAEGIVTQKGVDAALQAAVGTKAEVVIFGGTQVLGQDKLLKYTAERLTALGMAFGYVEMAKQVGEERLAQELHCKIVRCHALAAAEMVKVSPAKAVDRFRLAVRERNVRLCYIRPYALAGDDPLYSAQEHVSQVTQVVLKAGLKTGSPVAFGDVRVPKPLLALCLMGAGAGLIWLLGMFFGLASGAFWGLVAADVVLSLGAAFAAAGIAGDLGALGAAVVFPVLALSAVRLQDLGGRPSLVRGVGLFLKVSATSLIGGLLIAACLSDLPHMMEVETFRGVKIAQVLPLLALLLIWAGRCTRSYEDVRTEMGEHAPEWPALWPGIVEACSAGVRYWHIVVMLAGLVMLAVMVVRSGNATPVPPSDLELHVRSLLDHALVIRPRTKEVFLGHPALILSLAFLLAGWRRGAWLGMLLGAIGQVSLVNTFGHIHTPLWVTLARVGNGLWLSVLVAGVVWLVIRRRVNCQVSSVT